MSRFQAGYFIEAIIKEMANGDSKSQIGRLLKYLSHFDLQSNKDLTVNNSDSIVAVVNNLISRGLPTLPTTFIEDRIGNTFIKTKKTTDRNSFSYKFVNDELHSEILRSLFIIDPRFGVKNIKSDYYENEITKQLITDFIPVNIGEYFIQLLTKKRKISSIYENSRLNYSISEQQKGLFDDDLFDFSVELPYLINDNAGLSINFEENKNEINTDYKHQELVAEALKTINWSSNAKIRNFGYGHIDDEAQKIIDFTFDDYFDNLRKNYKSPLYKSDYGLNAMQIALTPLAIARIQKTIVIHILSGDLSLTAKKWKIAVIERDVPAAFLAIEDLKKIFEHLFDLEGEKRKLPKIELSIYFTPEFEKAELNILYQGRLNFIEDFDSTEKFDILIDLSILLRSDFDFEKVETEANIVDKIRSISYLEGERNFVSDKNISYKTNFYDNISKTKQEKDLEQQTKKSLSYFYKNLFHKPELNYHQIKFLHKALANKNSLAVLAANDDKNLMYQFVSLLQPGISIIISPLMSSIKFQFESLRSMNIDATSYFSASTQRIFDKYSALKKLEKGQSLFNYITPDRLHLPEYRQTIKNSIYNNINIGLVIVDEAHCSSEWSHDFRPLYTTIPNSFSVIFEDNKLPIFSCFTETASYDVVLDLTDLYNIDKNNIIKIEQSVNNINLQFNEIEADYFSDKEELIESLQNSKCDAIKSKISKEAIIFGNNPSAIEKRLKNDEFSSGVFNGTIGDKLHTISTLKSRNSYRNFKKYNEKKNDILISTFSLGIGTNTNAKKIFFQSIPISTESFIQTLGRFYNSENVSCKVNYGIGKYSITKLDLDFEDDGSLQERQYSHEIFNEEAQRLRIFETLNHNIKKELQIVNEILNKVSYPSESISDMLIRRIRYSFDQWVRIVSQPQIEPTKLYVYDNQDENLGYIDFEQNSIVNMAGSSKKELANQVLAFLRYDIDKIVSNGIEIFLILDDKIGVHDSNGINNLWASLKKDEQATLTVEFYNNASENLAKRLKEEKGIILSHNQVIDFYEYSIDVDDFLNKFKKFAKLDKKEYRKMNVDIQNLYWSFRNFFDTIYAIHKLFVVGIIEDFIIDYQNQQFTLIITKRKDTDIINHIYNKILPFVSKNKAFEVFEQLPKMKGVSIIEKAVNYYQKFYHENVYKQRLNSYNFINDFVRKYTGNENKIRPLLNNYFSAKYLLKFENKLNEDFSFIEELFDINEIFTDELLHINKSSELLLNTHTGNHIFLIINGLSSILAFPDDNERLTHSIENLALGLSIYREKTDNPDLEKRLNWILDLFSKFNYEIRAKVETYLILKIHSNWLNKFNRKMSHILD